MFHDHHTHQNIQLFHLYLSVVIQDMRLGFFYLVYRDNSHVVIALSNEKQNRYQLITSRDKRIKRQYDDNSSCVRGFKEQIVNLHEYSQIFTKSFSLSSSQKVSRKIPFPEVIRSGALDEPQPMIVDCAWVVINVDQFVLVGCAGNDAKDMG